MLEGKVAIVTGGTRGIGFEIVKLFKENGCEVVLFGSREESVLKATQKLKEMGMDVKGYYPNLTDLKEVERVILEIKDMYGHIDILVNNAGVSQSKPIDVLTEEEFDSVMDLNVKGMFTTSKVASSIMKSQNSGVILNTSSMVSIYGQPSGIGYPTSKFAVNGFTLSLARELAPYHIRVNAVAPGITNTDMVSSLPKEVIDPLIKTIPLGRIGEVRDVANAFLFLASDMASYITGVVLSVDGLARS
jgi:3-oxoacyl-[acyl-carrier protein] reductase/7-alpha-hydroxysteroid dehydrogenase